MSNTKHTPEPWSACKDGYCSCGSINSADFPIATTVGKNNSKDAPYVSSEERRANALLIAAAPSLLEILIECEEYFDKRADADYVDEYIANSEMKLLTKIRSVIEKTKAKP